MSGDIYDSFTRPDALCSCDDPRNPACVAPGNHCSVLNIINKIAPYADRAQPGGWNDMDMLEVGNGGMTDDEVGTKVALFVFNTNNICSTKPTSLCGLLSSRHLSSAPTSAT
jgi:alpha-galactosidase